MHAPQDYFCSASVAKFWNFDTDIEFAPGSLFNFDLQPQSFVAASALEVFNSFGFETMAMPSSSCQFVGCRPLFAAVRGAGEIPVHFVEDLDNLWSGLPALFKDAV